MTQMNSYLRFQTPKAIAQPPRDARIANPAGPRELVMIVDDDDSVALLAESVLTAGGYRVITARDGFRAVDIFKKLREEIQLVILDFVMPIMDGADVLNELLRIDPHVRVVLTSGFECPTKLNGMLAVGLCGFIPKPLGQKKLLLSVRSTLDAIRSEDAIASSARR